MIIENISNLESVKTWLTRFQNQRTEKYSQHVALYRYHLTQEEYTSLKKVLIASFRFSEKRSFSREWCALFTLYGAEWFRREYSRDWSWKPIFNSLSFELSHPQIKEVIELGLQGYWKRPLSKYDSERNGYLGSVFREGGLPSNLLFNDSNNYQTAFYSIFGRYQEAKEFGKDAIERLIRSRISRLPKMFQGPESVELIADMVEQLDLLVYRFGLEKQTAPAKYLDAQYPRWREHFPLPLENSTGSAFLSQLLNKASDEVRKIVRKEKILSCAHYLSFANQAISTEVSLPHAFRFELSQAQLSSSRIELAIFEDEHQVASLGTGYVQFENEQAVVRIRNTKVNIRRINESSELYITAMQAGYILADIRLDKSSVDVGDSPLTLLDKDDRWLILGQASVSSKYEKIGILIPRSYQTKVIYGQLIERELSFAGCQLNELEGKCELLTEQGEKFVISTGAENFYANQITLKGEQLRWKSIPSLVFKGVPSVSDTSGIEDSLLTYIGNNSVNSLSCSEIHGRQLLTVRTNEGIILLRKRVGILSADFDIEIISGEIPSCGVVKVISSSPCVCKLISDQVKLDQMIKRDGVKELWLSTTGMPPATVSIQILANMLAEPIILEIPFPSRGAVAFDANKKPLAKKIVVDDLLGSRLHLFSSQGVPANFQVEAIASSKCSRANSPYIRWCYKVTDKPLEVSLYSLKDAILELLSLTDQLDSSVELTISGPGQTQKFFVSHYETTVEHNRSTNTVTIKAQSLSSVEKAKPVLISLSAPEQKPIVLNSRLTQGVPTGEYELPTYIENGGPWLIVPSRSSDVSFRAKFLPSTTDIAIASTVNTLQKASMLYHPRYNPDVIANVLAQMTTDWSHSGWQYLKDTYQNFLYLPLVTFEVWRYLARNNRALATAIFVFEMNEKFISHLENELPIFWEFITLEDWSHAVSLMTGALHKSGLPESVVKQVCSTQLNKLAVAIPALSDTVVNYLNKECKLQSIPVPIMESIVIKAEDSWYQDLLRQHSENNHWPTECATEIKNICHSLNLLPFNLQVNSGFQTGVVYLPIFAAAMASGLIPDEMSKRLSVNTIFHLRKLRDFDSTWFESVYRCFISYFLNRVL